MTSAALFGGVMIVILGVTLLGVARTRRPRHRH
jgi:hypothetical protein